MVKLFIVGLGSLGSGLVTEIAKRSLALKFPLELYLFDDDTVEERNVVAQAFDPVDIGKSKVEAMAERLKSYNLLTVHHSKMRVTRDNINSLGLDDKSILIDAVDNIQTRHLLWERGLLNVPVLHLGMSTSGSGNIGWNWNEVDTFNLSPKHMSPTQLDELLKKVEKTLPPCELNSMRGLITNTILAALNALFIFMGKDSTKEFSDAFEDQEVPGVMSTWTSFITGHQVLPQLTQLGEWTN